MQDATSSMHLLLGKYYTSGQDSLRTLEKLHLKCERTP